MRSIEEVGLHEPIDVLEVEGVYYVSGAAEAFERQHGGRRRRARSRACTAGTPARCQVLPSRALTPARASAQATGVPANAQGFSGCHRFEAHQRLGKETILCRVRKANRQALLFHMM